MKVLNIIQRYPPGIGGSETWCRNLCLFLAKKGISTRVATINIYNVSEAVICNFPKDESVKLGKVDFDGKVFVSRYKLWKRWVDCPSVRISQFFLFVLKLYKTEIGEIFHISPHSFVMYKNLFKEIKNTDAVILHTLPYFHNLVGFIIAKLYGKIIVMVPSFHPCHPHYEKKIIFRMLKHCDAVITHSEYEKSHLVSRKVNANKIFVSGCAIPEQRGDDNGAGCEQFKAKIFNQYKISEKHKKIIFLGRKELYKGIFHLIEALQKLAQEKDKDMYLFLVGPAIPDFSEVFSKLDDTGRLKVIDFGEVSDREKNYLLQISDLLALPSKFESFGIVFLEAWRYGKPVVGADRGAMPEIIGNAGLCAEYGNALDLKNKIKSILFDPERAKEMGANGKKKVENQFCEKNVYGSVLRILNNLKGNRKRVLLVSLLFPPQTLGGAEIVTYEQGKKLKETGLEVKIFAGKINDRVKRFKITRENKEFPVTRINLHTQDFSHHKYANLDKKGIRERFRGELDDFAPDIIHFHSIYALSLEMLDDCVEMNIPTVMTLHDYWGICHNNLLVNDDGGVCCEKDGACLSCKGELVLENGSAITLSERNARCLEYYNKVTAFISPSNYLAQKYIERGIKEEKMQVIANGIDTSLFKKNKKTKSSKIRFGYVGQVEWHKGIETLLHAMSLLNNSEKEKISLTIIGSGNKVFFDYCKAVSKELEFITFLGKIGYHRIGAALNHIDILIVPSLWPENSPNAIFEAMATGTPVIASNLGGIPELIKDSRNGLFFQHNNSRSLADKVRWFIDNPAQIEKMRLCCLKVSQDHDIGKQVNKIMQCYDSLIHGQ